MKWLKDTKGIAPREKEKDMANMAKDGAPRDHHLKEEKEKANHSSGTAIIAARKAICQEIVLNWEKDLKGIAIHVVKRDIREQTVQHQKVKEKEAAKIKR